MTSGQEEAKQKQERAFRPGSFSLLLPSLLLFSASSHDFFAAERKHDPCTPATGSIQPSSVQSGPKLDFNRILCERPAKLPDVPRKLLHGVL